MSPSNRTNINSLSRVIVLVTLLLSPAALMSIDEGSQWNKAQRSEKLSEYDDYVTMFPEGPHSREAKTKAAKLSASQISEASGSCDKLYPRMTYYCLAATPEVHVSPDTLSQCMARAAECSFPLILLAQDTYYAAEGMLSARYVMGTRMASQLEPRTFIDTHRIMLDLEEAVIYSAQDEIIKCSDQNAWVDTPLKKRMECSKPYMKTQTRMGRAMGDQAKYDIENISNVDNAAYRLEFWERYRKLAKKDIMAEISQAYDLYDSAKKAMAEERNPEVADKIETVSIRLAGAGKPVGGVRIR